MKSLSAMFLGSALVLMLCSCASIPEVTDPSGVDITFRELTAGDLIRHTVDKGLNPYTNVGYLTNRPDDYIVLRALITTNRSLSYEIARIDAFNAEGSKIASFYDRMAFLEHQKKWTTDLGDYTRLEREVQSTYLPYKALRLKPGKRGYILVLVGKKPIPKAVTLRGLAFIDNSTSSFEVTLPVD